MLNTITYPNHDQPSHMKFHFNFMLFSGLLGRCAVVSLNHNAFVLSLICIHVSDWISHYGLLKWQQHHVNAEFYEIINTTKSDES